MELLIDSRNISIDYDKFKWFKKFVKISSLSLFTFSMIIVIMTTFSTRINNNTYTRVTTILNDISLFLILITFIFIFTYQKHIQNYIRKNMLKHINSRLSYFNNSKNLVHLLDYLERSTEKNLFNNIIKDPIHNIFFIILVLNGIFSISIFSYIAFNNGSFISSVLSLKIILIVIGLISFSLFFYMFYVKIMYNRKLQNKWFFGFNQYDISTIFSLKTIILMFLMIFFVLFIQNSSYELLFDVLLICVINEIFAFITIPFYTFIANHIVRLKWKKIGKLRHELISFLEKCYTITERKKEFEILNQGFELTTLFLKHSNNRDEKYPSRNNLFRYRFWILELKILFNEICRFINDYNNHKQLIEKLDDSNNLVEKSFISLLKGEISLANKEYNNSFNHYENAENSWKTLKIKKIIKWSRYFLIKKCYVNSYLISNPKKETQIYNEISKLYLKIWKSLWKADTWSLFYFIIYRILFYVRISCAGDNPKAIQKARKLFNKTTNFSKEEEDISIFLNKIISATDNFTNAGKTLSEEKEFIDFAKENTNSAAKYLLKVQDLLGDKNFPVDTLKKINRYIYDGQPKKPQKSLNIIIFSGLVSSAFLPAGINLITNYFSQLPKRITGIVLVLIGFLLLFYFIYSLINFQKNK